MSRERAADIERTRMGRWEKLGYLISLGGVFPGIVALTVLEGLGYGFWERIGLALLLCVAVAYLASRPAAAERSRRLALDLTRGVFDCAIRYPSSRPGALRDRWNPGVAQLDGKELWFQPQNFQGDPNPTPAGPPRKLGLMTAEGTVDLEGKRPVELRRGWQVLAVETEHGCLHLAGAAEALALLKNQLLS